MTLFDQVLSQIRSSELRHNTYRPPNSGSYAHGCWTGAMRTSENATTAAWVNGARARAPESRTGASGTNAKAAVLILPGGPLVAKGRGLVWS